MNKLKKIKRLTTNTKTATQNANMLGPINRPAGPIQPGDCY